MTETTRQFASLGITLLGAWFIWRFYRTRKFSLAEKYSTFSPRFWTGWVDACVLWPINFSVYILLTLGLSTGLGVVLVLVQSFAWLFYTVGMHAKYGQTYGKMVCKVRVVDFRTEGSLSFRQAFIREVIPVVLSAGLAGYEIYAIGTGALSQANIARGEFVAHRIFWFLAGVPFLWAVAEGVSMLMNEKRRALHDFIAGTVVVRTNAAD